MKFNLRKAVILALSVVLFAGAPVFVYSVSDATGNSSKVNVPKPAPQNNALNGVKSDTRGSYDAWSVPGINVKVDTASFGTTSEEELAKQTGMPQNAKAFVRTWDISEKNSPAAYGCLKAAADASGATMGPTVEVDVRMRDAKTREEKELTGGTTNLEIGIPKNFRQDGARYGVVRVVAGGESTILEGAVENNVLKFTAPSGNAAYALIRYDE